MNSKKYAAEAIGTFWLVLGGCGSAVLAAAFPEVGHRPARRVPGLRPDRADDGLLRSATSRAATSTPPSRSASTAGGRFPGLGRGALHRGAGGRRRDRRRRALRHRQRQARLRLIGGFASNGYGDLSPGKYGLLAALVTEVVMTAMFLFIIMGSTHGRAPAGFAPIAIGLGPDPDPPDLDPGHQHLGQPGPQHRRRAVRRRRARSASSGCSGWRRSWAAPSAALLYSLAVAQRRAGDHRQHQAPLSRPGCG